APAAGADGAAMVADLASLEGAGPGQLSFFTGGRDRAKAFAASRAGFCLAPEKGKLPAAPAGMVLIRTASVQQAFAAIAALFYPGALRISFVQPQPIHPSAKLGRNVELAPGVVIGAGVEIGEGSTIGAGAAIAPGVTIGKHCQIGSQVTIAY